MIKESITRAAWPTGGYVSSKKITHDIFGEEAEKTREAMTKNGMNFLYQLVHKKLQASQDDFPGFNEPVGMASEQGDDSG